MVMARSPFFQALTLSLILSCRLAAADGADQSGYFCEDIKKPFFAAVPGRGGLFSPQRPAALPDSFYMPKPGGLKRVFILGESVAAILGQVKTSAANTALLDGPASASAAGGVVEIINCGMGGYASYRISGVLKEVLDYKPDLVVILSGNNEGLSEPPCPGAGFELPRRKFKLLERYYSLKYGPSQAGKKASIKMHTDMLEEMARAAKKARVPVVFCTLPANISDMPPRTAPPLDDERFAAGYRLFYDGNYLAAAEEFRRGLETRPHEPFFSFYLGKALEKLGKPSEARPYFLDAVEFSEDMTRAGRERNAAVRRTAAEEGACVADLENFFSAIPGNGLTGFLQFTDGLHWKTSYNKAVWNEIFRSAGACGIKGFENFKVTVSTASAESPREDARKRLSYAVSWLDEQDFNEGALAELSYIRENDPALLREAAVSQAVFESLFIRNFRTIGRELRFDALFTDFLEYLAETERRGGDYAAALSLCDRAIALKPGDVNFSLERAQILAGLGKKQDAADEFFVLAEDYSDARYKARALRSAYGFGSASDAQNTRKLSYEDLGGGLRAVDTLINTCFGLVREEKKEEALRACQDAAYSVYSSTGNRPEALEMLGSDASFESYRLLTELGRADEAAETLFWTITNAPASWPKLSSARELLKRSGPANVPAPPGGAEQ